MRFNFAKPCTVQEQVCAPYTLIYLTCPTLSLHCGGESFFMYILEPEVSTARWHGEGGAMTTSKRRLNCVSLTGSDLFPEHENFHNLVWLYEKQQGVDVSVDVQASPNRLDGCANSMRTRDLCICSSRNFAGLTGCSRRQPRPLCLMAPKDRYRGKDARLPTSQSNICHVGHYLIVSSYPERQSPRQSARQPLP